MCFWLPAITLARPPTATLALWPEQGAFRGSSLRVQNTRAHTRIHTCTYTRMHAHMRTHTQASTQTHTHTHAHTHAHAHTHTHTRSHIHTQTHTLAHTHTSTHAHGLLHHRRRWRRRPSTGCAPTTRGRPSTRPCATCARGGCPFSKLSRGLGVKNHEPL